MKDKKGFVFLETIVVLMVVTLSLALLYSSYAMVSRKSKEKETYDRASDKYLLYAISNLGTTNRYNYSNLNVTSSNPIVITPTNCSTVNGLNNIFSTEKDDNGKTIYNCSKVLNESSISYLYVVYDVYKTLHTSGITTKIDNGTIEYMKTLKKCYDDDVFVNQGTINEDGNNINGTSVKDDDGSFNCKEPIKYMIGVFYRNQKYYFASMEI